MKPETRYTNVLEAVRKTDRGQWALGDALLRDIDESDGSDSINSQLRECSEMLITLGFPEYSFGALGDIRRTARNYPRPTRVDGVTFSVHRRCGNPDNLRTIIALLRKAGKPLTDRNTEFAMSEWQRQERDHRQAELAKANIDLEAARFRKREAAEAELRTVNPEKREQARKDKSKAERDENEAQNRRAKAKEAPKRSTTFQSPPPDNTALDVLARVHAVCDSAHKMRNRLRDNIKVIDDMIYLLEPESKEKIIESYREVDALVTSTLNRFEAKKGGLRAIKGGAA